MGSFTKFLFCMAAAVLINAAAFSPANALNSLTVVDDTGTAVTKFRWLLEEDTTHPVTPGTHDTASLGVSIHKSYAPVVRAGDDTNLAPLFNAAVLNPANRYFLSILPDQSTASVKRSNGGTSIGIGQTSATVLVNVNPIPTAQILVYAF